MASPYRFAQHSEAGVWVSEAFLKLAEKVDDQSMAIRIGYSVIGLGCLVGVGFLIVNAVRK